jgi:hypothetical protein
MVKMLNKMGIYIVLSNELKYCFNRMGIYIVLSNKLKYCLFLLSNSKIWPMGR